MKRLALLLLVVACGSEDPHALGPCQGWTDNLGNPFTGQCELACKTPPQNTQMTCDTTAQLNCTAFEFDDLRGCCVPDVNGGTPIRFFECH